MTKIELDERFLHKVASGTKRQTVRKGRKDYELGEAELDLGGKIIPITITDIVYKKLYNLNDWDAKLDGFSHEYELVLTLRDYYIDLKYDDTVTLVKWESIKNGAQYV